MVRDRKAEKEGRQLDTIDFSSYTVDRTAIKPQEAGAINDSIRIKIA